MGSDDLFKKEKQKREERKKYRRGKEKDAILIICEGKKTEPNYFICFREQNRLKNIIIDGTGTNTDTIVKKAIKESKKYDQVWCVFDRDSFPPHNFNRAFDLVKSKPKIKIAYSNEAFELWYLLHYNYYDTALSRIQYEGKLTELLGYKYKKNSTTMYEELLDKQQTAIDNARRLLEQYPDLNPERDNPSTTVHLLVKELNKYVK